MEFLIPIVVVAVVVVFGILGCWIASQKRRDQTEGFILGLLFGPIGVIIEAVLPTLVPSPPPPPDPAEDLTEEELERIRDQRRRLLAAEQAKKLAADRELEEWRKRRIEEMRRENEERERRLREAKAAVSRSMKGFWLWIPDWVKMTAVGLVMGAILCIPIVYWAMSNVTDVGPTASQPRSFAKATQRGHADAKIPPPPQPF